MTLESYAYGDPARVLMRRGQDCTGCVSLATTDVFGRSVTACDNMAAPTQKREQAPARRCHWFRHKGPQNGQ